MDKKKVVLMFLFAVLVVGISSGIFRSIVNNYLKEVHSFTGVDRGIIEFPRELFGFLIVFVVGSLHFISERRLIGLGIIAVAFSYIGFSPKEKRVQDNVVAYVNQIELSDDFDYDIKIVTDLETEGVDMIDNATLLMPLTTYDKNKDLEMQRKVWKYCVANNIKYAPRIHVDIWGQKRGV